DYYCGAWDYSLTGRNFIF
nr:immunoglobulin light chain junction region [Macaca mulatta]